MVARRQILNNRLVQLGWNFHSEEAIMVDPQAVINTVKHRYEMAIHEDDDLGPSQIVDLDKIWDEMAKLTCDVCGLQGHNEHHCWFWL